jgi:hypothetical protein
MKWCHPTQNTISRQERSESFILAEMKGLLHEASKAAEGNSPNQMKYKEAMRVSRIATI